MNRATAPSPPAPPARPARAHALSRCVLAAALAALAAACAEGAHLPGPAPDDYGDKGPGGPDSEDGFQRAGTGSAGGNPLTFTFDTVADEADDDDDLNTLVWQPPSFHIERVTVQDPASPSGQCNATGAIRLIQLDGAFTTDSAHGFDIAPPLPCAITLRPATDAPFLTAHASLGALGPLHLAVDLPQGLVFDIHRDAAPLAQPLPALEAYILIDPSALLHSVEPAELLRPEALIALGQPGDNPLRDRLIANLLSALTVYLDPTPGDGLILPSERVEANVLATLSLGRKIGSSKAAP